MAASEGLADLIARRSSGVYVVMATEEELQLALRLEDSAEREWRRSLGMKARRLDAGEAVSIAIAVLRGEPLATDDGQAVVAFRALGGTDHYWTRDLVKHAVTEGMLRAETAREGYERLRTDYRFHAPPW